MANSGKMRCKSCGMRVTASLNRNVTRVRSSVHYRGHTNKINGQKKSCPSTTVRYGDVGFPQWAYKALSDLPLE